MNNLEWLEEWYRSNCDGLWEHLYGVKIETLDNPGWCVKIDLNETAYANLQDKKLVQDINDNDWIMCSIVDGIFKGHGDCMKLDAILHTFKTWISDYNLKMKIKESL